MIQEIAIDRDLDAVDGKRGDAQPFGIGVAGRLAGRPLAQEDDVGDDGRAFAFEGVGWQADRPDEIGLRAEIFADGGILFVEREMRRDHGQDAAGLQGVDGLGEEVIVQRQLLPAIVELEVGERHVADHRVNAAFGQLACRGSSRCGCPGRGAAPWRCGRRWSPVSTPMKRCPSLPWLMKLPDAAAGSRMVASVGDAQAGDGLVDGGDDGGRRVEGVEGGALGAVVFLRREQRLQLFAEGLPAGVLVAAGDRIGEYRQGHRTEAAEAGKNPHFLQRRRPAPVAQPP